MHYDTELSEFIELSGKRVTTAVLDGRGLTLTREDGTERTFTRYTPSHRGIPGLDTEAAATIAFVLGIEDEKSRKAIAAIVEENDDIRIKVTDVGSSVIEAEVITKTTWHFIR